MLQSSSTYNHFTMNDFAFYLTITTNDDFEGQATNQ